MKEARKTRAVGLICGLAFLGLLSAVGAGQGRMVSSGGSAHCISPRKVEVGHASRASANAWRVVAGVRNNGSCKSWLLSIAFRPTGLPAWGTGTGIPVNGHVPSSQRLNARDVRGSGGKAAFLGYVGSSVGEIRADFADGSHSRIVPRLPARSKRRQNVWVRGFAFFVSYHSPESPVVSASVFNRNGKLLYRVRGEGGEFS